ncbi:MAG: T9SS type A sorting domain-containing protein [Chitinophagaceae bacterium]
MKQQVHNKRLKVIIVLSVFSGLLFSQPALAESKPYISLGEFKAGEKIPVKTKFKTKLFSSKNNSSVKIYPDFIKREMHVIAKYNNKEVLDFFVFDIQGTLISHKKMKANDHETLKNFKRGKYIYRVFTGDEETAAGELEFR